MSQIETEKTDIPVNRQRKELTTSESQIETEKTDIPVNRQRKESTTSEEEEIQSDKTKKLQNNLVGNKYLLNFKKWPIFTLLEEEILLRIDLALIYNDGALIVTSDKMTYAIGNNKNHRLGIPEGDNVISWPRKVEILCNKNIKKFTYGYYMFALTEEGEVYSWDYKAESVFKVGHNNTILTEPIKLELKKKHIIDIACNETDLLVLTGDGKVYIYSRFDILYLHPSRLASSSESESESIKPASSSETQIPYIIQEENFDKNKIVCIACGTSFIMAVTDMGEIYSRGLHLSPCSNYMLNDNSSNIYHDLCEHQRFTEKRTELSSVVIVKVVCGYAHALALSNEGQLYIFKQNYYYNLLNIPKLQKVLDIAAVYHSDRSAILGDNGCIYVWGNYFGYDIEFPIVTEFSTVQEALMHDIDTYPIILSMNELGYIDVQSDILKCSQTLFDDPSTSDFTIQVKNHSIYVHKAILRSRSEYFEAMFRNFKEKDQSILTLPSVYSYTAYKAFLKYLYTGAIDLFSMHKLLKLFKLAMMLCDTKLISSCIREIKRKVTPANVIFVYSTAMEYDNENLKKFSIKFAVNYMLSTTQIESDKKIDENILESFKKEVANARVLLDL